MWTDVCDGTTVNQLEPIASTEVIALEPIYTDQPIYTLEPIEVAPEIEVVAPPRAWLQPQHGQHDDFRSCDRKLDRTGY